MSKDLIDLTAQEHEAPTSIAEPSGGMTAPRSDSVPCMYCRGPIESASFVYSSAAKRLVSASCPTCGHGITVATATWHRWMASDTATNEIDLRT